MNREEFGRLFPVYALEMVMDTPDISEVLQRHTGELMAITGVEGVGEGVCLGKPCIRVFVTGNKPRILKKIPATLEGYAVCVEESGEFRALK